MPADTNKPLLSINDSTFYFGQLTEIENFRTRLRESPGDDEKFQLCIARRNEILESHANLEALIAGFESVMSAECELYRNNKTQWKEHRSSSDHDDDIARWNQFIGMAANGSHNFKARLGPLMRVSKFWGKERILHYKWYACGEKYCKILGTAVGRVSKWDEATIKLNQLILRRMNTPRSRIIPEDVNPISQTDLENLQNWINQDKYVRGNDPEQVELLFRGLSADELPDGYGFDKFGLLVRAAFAVSMRKRTPQGTKDKESINPQNRNQESKVRESSRRKNILNDVRENHNNDDKRDKVALRPRDVSRNYGGMSTSGSRITKFRKQDCCTDVPRHVKDLFGKSLESKESIRSAQPYHSKLCHKHLQKYTILLSSLVFPETSDSISQRNSPSTDPTPNRRRSASAASLDFNMPRSEKHHEDNTLPSQEAFYNSELAENFRCQVLEDLGRRLSLLPEGSHDWKHNHLIHTLLGRALPARDGTEVHLLPGKQAAEMLESARNGHLHAPIITHSQQAFQWDGSSRPIEQLFERMGGLQHNISVEIPSGDGECKSITLADIHERFVSNKETTEPLNVPDLYNPVLGVLPAFLMGENCQLLSRIHDLFLMSNCEMISWMTRKKIEGFAVLSEGGHNTVPAMDIHGYATWLTVQEGNVGFGWMSDSTRDDRRSWMSDPRNFTRGQWKYAVLGPGQSIFFDSGSIRFIFQVKNNQSLILGGHILRWTHIVHWINTVTAQEQANMFSENIVSLTASYIEAVNTLVDHKKSFESSDVVKGFKNCTLRRGPSKSPYVIINSSEEHQINYHDVILGSDSFNRLTRDKDDGYLDDQLVLFYLWFLRDQLAHQGAPDCPVINPVILELIAHETNALQHGVSVDIFTSDFVIAPMIYNDDYQHWYLAIICHSRSLLEGSESHDSIPRLILLDSLFEERPEGEKLLKGLITSEAKRQNKSIRMNKLHISSPETFAKSIPGQPPNNSYDCGLYILIYCEKFLLDPMDFIQKFVVESTPLNKKEWGNLQSHRMRQRYSDLNQRFIGSRRRDGVLIDAEGVEIIDGELGPGGRGLMRRFQQ